MEELFKTLELLESLKTTTNTMSWTCFGSFFCMLLEEWCKYNGEDIINVLPQLTGTIVQVNADEGRY